jgi:hypothetical protein
MFDTIAEIQMKRAERELALHRHLLPTDFKFRREDEPFGGW